MAPNLGSIPCRILEKKRQQICKMRNTSRDIRKTEYGRRKLHTEAWKKKKKYCKSVESSREHIYTTQVPLI